jgi:hypothetical protein
VHRGLRQVAIGHERATELTQRGDQDDRTIDRLLVQARYQIIRVRIRCSLNTLTLSPWLIAVCILAEVASNIKSDEDRISLTLVRREADLVAIDVGLRQGDTIHGIRGLADHRRWMASKRHMSRVGTGHDICTGSGGNAHRALGRR